MHLGEVLFFAFFVLLSVTKGLGFYEGQKLFALLVFPALLCGFAKIVITPYTRGQWVLQLVLLVVIAVTYFSSRQVGILFVGFLVLGMKDISVRKVIHTGVWVWSVCAVVLILFSFLRLEHTVYRVHDKMGLGHIFRWSLGFTHPNILHITYLAICAMLLYEWGEQYRLRHFAALMIGNLLIFIYSVSYTGVAIVTVLLMAGIYVRVRPRFCFLEKAVANLVLPGCVLLSVIFPLMMFGTKYAGPLQHLNQILNTRLYLAWLFLQPEYLSLFGRDLSGIVQSSMNIDNSYIWGLVNYGILPFALLILGYFVLGLHAAHRQRTRELVILACFLVAGWTEPLLFNTSFKNLTLIFLGAMLYGQSEGGTERTVQNRREYELIPGLADRAVRIPFAAIPERMMGWMKQRMADNRKKVLLCAGAGMAAGALLCLLLYRVPEGYVVPRFYTDGLEQTSVYLESAEDPAYEQYVVMNYVDETTPMQLVTGDAVQLEMLRYYMGSVLIGGFAGVCTLLAVLGIQERKR